MNRSFSVNWRFDSRDEVNNDEFGWQIDQIQLEVEIGPGDCNCNGIPDELDIPGDFDADGDVDMIDFARFQGCSTGPGVVELAPGCCFFDFDSDRDVDLDDYAEFHQEFTRPLNP